MIVISQGPLVHPELTDEAWHLPVIHSTWDGERSCKNAIYSQQPEIKGIQNVALQQKSTLMGLWYAKERGHEYAFKIRSDMYPTNSRELMKLQKSGLNFLFWHNHNGGYLVDYLMSGKIDDLINIWSFKNNNDFPEKLLTNQAIHVKIKHIEYFGSFLTPENDIFWTKNNIYLSSYQKDKLFVDDKSNFI